MRTSLVLILAGLLTQFDGWTGEDAGETRVTVKKGTLVVERGGTSTRLQAGEETRLVNGSPTNVAGITPSDPVPVVPIAIQWEPGQTVLMADGTGILLRSGPSGSEGKSPNGRYLAKLSADGELLVSDLLHNRQAVRSADGRWTHHFAGCEMRIDPQGHATVRLPDGRELGSPATEPREPAVTRAPPPGYRWQIGIHLDKTANGLRVAQVSPGSPAEAAGFQPGDEILSIADLQSPSLDQILEKLRQARPAQKIPFTVRREERTLTRTVLMGAWE